MLFRCHFRGFPSWHCSLTTFIARKLTGENGSEALSSPVSPAGRDRIANGHIDPWPSSHNQRLRIALASSIGLRQWRSNTDHPHQQSDCELAYEGVRHGAGAPPGYPDPPSGENYMLGSSFVSEIKKHPYLHTFMNRRPRVSA